MSWDAERTLSSAFDRDAIPWSRELLIAVGECAFKRTFALGGGTNIEAFFDGGETFARSFRRGDATGVNAFVLHQLQVQGLLAPLVSIARWYEQGCPIVMLASQTHAAALAATSLPPDTAVPTPYHATLFQFPNMFDSLWATLVHRPEYDDGLWNVVTFFQDGRMKKSCTRIPLSDHIRGAMDIDDPRLQPTIDISDKASIAASWKAGKPSDEQMRNIQVGTRIALGACLAVTAHHPSDGSQGGGSVFRSTKEAPIYRTLSFGRPVQIDARHAIRDYIAHGSNSKGPLTLQFMVRGHWRNQACGTAFTERRLTWIEPYWKGPEDAPVNVRAHVVKGAGA